MSPRLTAAATRRSSAVLSVLAALAGSLTLVAGPTTSAAADVSAPVRDGRTAATALASCWDVKQVTPTAKDGVYWLYTPALGYPQQFYCDQTTDGGGWTLIARGRDNWAFTYPGQGRPAEVFTPVAGTGAFAPKMLPGGTVDALLGGGNVKDLPDGIRLRRAANATGTLWQEVRLRPSTMGRWRWAFNGGYPLTNATFKLGAGPTLTYTGATSLVSGDGGFNTLQTTKRPWNTSKPGWAYGSRIVGTNTASTYLYSVQRTGYAQPFTQVYLRPKTRWADQTFPTVGTTGLPGSTVRSVASNLAMPQPAGVSGLANGRSAEVDTEVRAMAQLDTRMYVGGNFAQVDEYAAKRSTAQSYLAAFDVATGAWVPTFRPVLNGKVNAVAALPNGLLAVGGEFTVVNGVNQPGLVVLDPDTGATAATFKVAVASSVANNRATGPGRVLSLAVQGTWLYVAGNFNHLSAGGAPYASAVMGGRIDLTTLRPDTNWSPGLDGTATFVVPSEQGDRVYFGGYFTHMLNKTVAAPNVAVVATTRPASAVPGMKQRVPSSPGGQYQWAGAEVGDRVWIGGAEHSLFMYDRADFTLLRGNIARSDATTAQGGDFQTIAVDGDVVYGSCHCALSDNFGNGRAWPYPTGFDAIDSIRYISAYDATTGVQLSTFLPEVRTRAVRGMWGMTLDADRCLWAGGDTTQTRSAATGAWQSSGGFARFCRADAEAPTVPTKVSAVKNADGTVTVSWTGSTDNKNAGGIRYSVFADDHVVSTGPGWKVTLPAMPDATRYAVRAFDAAGNVSATTTPVTA